MNVERIAELARGLTPIRGGAIYALMACTALTSALYSCSEPPAPQPSTPAIVAATPVPSTHTPMPPTAVPTAPPQTTLLPKPSLTPPPTPTPTAVPDTVYLPEDAQFTQIAAGWRHACGLQADGTPLCWGGNWGNALAMPSGLTLSRISAGNKFTCGLSVDGAIVCWGADRLGQSSPPAGRFYDVAAGQNHACALSDGGALTCWGKDFPDGAETIEEVPTLLSIQAGAGLTCGLTPNANMACWDNGDEHLAALFGDDYDGSGLEIIPGPFAELAVGLHHACAISVDGSVLCRSEDRKHYSQRARPPSTKFVQADGGLYHACGITEASEIECWGSLVPGAPGERLSAPEGKFAAVSIAHRHSCALTPDGYATCWHQPDIQTPLEPLREAFGGIEFDQPTELFPLPDGRIAVAERKGTIVAYSDEPDAAPPEMVLDLTDKTVCCLGESGLFSAALDPQFDEFPFLYVYREAAIESAYGENMFVSAGRLSRFRVERGRALRDSELIIMEAPHHYKYHYGGAIRFGADGMLYLGIGDNNHLAIEARELDSLRGKIIRIDVRGGTPNNPYRVPPDNPFVGNPEARPEIWAYGLRNPWRMDFAPDGRLFIADVGWYNDEEVSLAAAGANLGWPLCEGIACGGGLEADDAGLTPPIHTYGKEDGCAIIGGVTAPRLDNGFGFIFGDYCKGQVWLLEHDEREGWRARQLAQAEGQILSFGINAAGQVYALLRGKPIMRLQLDGEE